jgi:uncharacterized sulfatase
VADTIDDMGSADLACYGRDAATPNIDRLAAEGIRFTQAYVALPACSPSLVASSPGNSRRTTTCIRISRQRPR